MKVGIGLPNAVPGVGGGAMREWAVRAEAAGFSTLGTIDRLVYPSHEPFMVLSYAAGATERIGLLTSILLGPLRSNAALFAKQAASLDMLSGGRFTLGVSVGGREDDFEASGLDYHERGAALDRQLEEMQRLWGGEKVGFAGGVGPHPGEGRPELIVGGASDASYRRAARFGNGWMMGGGPIEQYRERIARLRAAWAESERPDEPRILALGYYALGPDPRDQARRYITDYYAFIGDEAAAGFAESIPATPEAIRETRDAFAAEGCDEFIFIPTAADPAQVDLLADVVF